MIRSVYFVSYGSFKKYSFPPAFNLSSFVCRAHSEYEARGFALEKCKETFPAEEYETNYLIHVNKCDMESLIKCCEEYNKDMTRVETETNPLFEIKL